MRLNKVLLFGGLFACTSTVFVFHIWKRATAHIQYDQRWTTVEQSYASFIEEHPYILPNKSRPSLALHYCNFPNPVEDGKAEEGKPLHTRWILKQVQVVVRHGDRSPINDELYKRLGVTPDYCRLRQDRKPTHALLSKFVQTMQHDQLKMTQAGRKHIMPYPNSHVCGSATLSQLGVIQHIRNGEVLRQAYADHKLLTDAIQKRSLMVKKVYVASTKRSRTIRSAVAFLYGLIPDFHLDQVNIKYRDGDVFSSTYCKALLNMEPSIKKVQYEAYLGHRTMPAFRKLDSLFSVGDHAGVLIDRFVTGFLCKGIELPCKSGSCVTVEDLDVILQAEENTTRLISERSAFVNKSMLNLQPLLEQLSDFMIQKSTGKTLADFVLFSGHDTTLKPLIAALGIPVYRWPKPGSRLVFELWWDPDDKKNYVRILLNGKDYTMLTNPCAPVGQFSTGKVQAVQTCEAEKFYSYIKHGIFERLGFNTRKQACAMSG